MAKAAFKIIGMDCAEEVSALRKELGPMQGIRDLGFDVFNAKMTVDFDDTALNIEKLQVAVKRTGMTAEPWSETATQSAPPSNLRQGRTLLTIASGLLVAAGFVSHSASVGIRAAVSEGDIPIPLPAKILYGCAVVTGVWFVAPKAWIALRRMRPDMNLLMVIAALGAIVIGQWFEAGTVAFLFALSILLEAWSVGRARRAVAALMALTPPKARVLHGAGEHAGNDSGHKHSHGKPSIELLPKVGCKSGDCCGKDEGTKQLESADTDHGHGAEAHEHMMDVAAVAIGSTVAVKPGEKFPLDGKITKGQTSVNQAPITGESLPVEKSPGSEVFAGSINGDGAVEFITTKAASDTTVAHIIKMVGEAQSRRSPSEQWVEKFARYYTPLVMLLALSVIVVPPLLFGGMWSKWFYEGLVLLVIACPCALVISTPVSIVAALASAAKNGVLIKGGLFVEVPSRIKAIALDKTGTLTAGKPAVMEVVPLSGHTEAELIEIAAAIESPSEHPLARAVLAFAATKGIRPKPAEQYQAIKGKGASAILDGKKVWLGSHRYLEERGQETPEMHSKLESLSAGGASVIVIGNDEHVCGFIAVADRVRANAKAAVESLRSAGIQTVVMLTGDNEGTAKSVAATTGVDNVKAELLPEDKVKAVEELVSRYGQVAMVGDGVNDAPAMARATLGIAMGAAGTDAAIETADIALMSDDLSRLAWLVGHSHRALGVIRQNIIASLAVKAAFVVLTLSGHASLWAAIAADTGMSLIVVFNALRLLGSSIEQD